MPRIPKDELKKALADRVARLDRGPFQEILGDGLAYRPKAKAWRELATKPEEYARTIKTLATLSGFVDRSESIQVKTSPTELAQTLVARYGADQARVMLQQVGLPASLAGPEPIDGEATETISPDRDAEPLPDTA